MTSGCFKILEFIRPSLYRLNVKSKNKKIYMGSVGNDMPKPPNRLSLLTDKGAKAPKNKSAFSVYKMLIKIAAIPIGNNMTQ